MAKRGKKPDNPKWEILDVMMYYLNRFFKEKYILRNRDLLPVSGNSKVKKKKKKKSRLDPTFRRKVLEKYPKAPQGSFPQNVINPKLTRIFLTDVISKPDVKP